MYDISPVSSSLFTIYSVSKPDLKLKLKEVVSPLTKLTLKQIVLPLTKSAKFKLDGFSNVVRDRACTAGCPDIIKMIRGDDQKIIIMSMVIMMMIKIMMMMMVVMW